MGFKLSIKANILVTWQVLFALEVFSSSAATLQRPISPISLEYSMLLLQLMSSSAASINPYDAWLLSLLVITSNLVRLSRTRKHTLV
ncbi:uncharacterized protein BJ212DRAFT_57223 [Suillus subaureus]|uniref:Secreted protein n=1 Tax=Suillus subaureus TaxID=48587 RepID=A0A9P7EQV7_9AGAM|nr:uncharacterized protein BJ212DRAFT_57223 [Suillus subaureus]KAG1827513.1 hypothetical protein BJ212DRAFT_57223 [Suillus subaureus]